MVFKCQSTLQSYVHTIIFVYSVSWSLGYVGWMVKNYLLYIVFYGFLSSWFDKWLKLPMPLTISNIIQTQVISIDIGIN